MHSDLVETRPSLKAGSLEYDKKGLAALEKAEEDDIQRRKEIGERIAAKQEKEEEATWKLTELICGLDEPKPKLSPKKYS